VRSLFKRTGSYLSSATLDPGENRLTEAFAAVLERVDGLPSAVLRFWDAGLVPDHVQWEERIRTQRPTSNQGIVDLEIELRPTVNTAAPIEGEEDELVPLDRNVVCWVEIKHGAQLGMHADVAQTEAYEQAIPETLAGRTQIRLLVPRGFDSSRAKVEVGYWQELARFLKGWRIREGKNLPETSSWLIGEFLKYLKEENLMDEDRLTVEHAFVVSALPSTIAVMTRIWEVVDQQMKKEWFAPSVARRASLVHTFTNYAIDRGKSELASTWGSSSWLEWGIRPDAFREDQARGELVLYAGLSVVTKGSPLADPKNAPAVRALENLQFHRVFSEFPRLFRLRYVDDLLRFSTLEEQARDVADWVLETFQLIVANAPRVR
jgi:hypothetical protein